MTKTPFLVIVAGALLALHHHSVSDAEQKPGADARLLWTTRPGGKLDASLKIRGQNHARIVMRSQP